MYEWIVFTKLGRRVKFKAEDYGYDGERIVFTANREEVATFNLVDVEGWLKVS